MEMPHTGGKLPGVNFNCGNATQWWQAPRGAKE